MIDTAKDPRLPLFFEQDHAGLSAFAGFHGMEETIAHRRLLRTQPRVGRGKQISICSGRGGGKSSLESGETVDGRFHPIYVLKAATNLSPVFESRSACSIRKRSVR